MVQDKWGKVWQESHVQQLMYPLRKSKADGKTIRVLGADSAGSLSRTPWLIRGKRKRLPNSAQCPKRQFIKLSPSPIGLESLRLKRLAREAVVMSI